MISLIIDAINNTYISLSFPPELESIFTFTRNKSIDLYGGFAFVSMNSFPIMTQLSQLLNIISTIYLLRRVLLYIMLWVLFTLLPVIAGFSLSYCYISFSYSLVDYLPYI
jgi:hypothetical protein